MSDNAMVVALFVCIIFVFMFFGGSPDIQDAIITYLMK